MKFANTSLIVALLVFPLITFAQARRSTDERAKYINYRYEGVVPNTTLPNGVKHFGGGLIGDIDADPVYGISQVEKGKTKMLWLEASTSRDTRNGVTGWQVKDVLAFSGLTKSDYVFFSGDPAIYCKRNGQDVTNLAGVGQIVRRPGIFRPSKLFVANLTTKKFERVSTRGIKCEYSEP